MGGGRRGGEGGRGREGRGERRFSRVIVLGKSLGIFPCYIISFRIFTSTFSRCLFVIFIIQIHFLADRTGIFSLTEYLYNDYIQVYHV